VATLALAIVIANFSFIGAFALGEPDEARYAEIPREMIETGDWVTPRLNYVKYFEKPPLLYWLTAATFTVFGQSELVARLWPPLFALAGILVAYGLGCSMYGPWAGYAGAAVLATMPFYYGLGQVLILDMPLAGLMAIALGAFWFAYADARRRARWVLAMYAATALAVLTKGPVAAVLTGGTIALFLMLRRERRALRWVLSPPGLVVFVSLALPWFVVVSWRNPEFVDFFVVKQHLARFLAPDEHHQPLWFFVPIVFGGTLPWAAFILAAPQLVRDVVARVLRGRVHPGTLYCLIWAAVVFVFFSFSASKLATYVLPMFCPLAVLAGRFVQQAVEGNGAIVIRRLCVVLLGVAGAALLAALIAAEVVDAWEMHIILPRASVGAAVVAVGALLALRWLRRADAQASLAILVCTLLAFQMVVISGRDIGREYRPLGRAIRAQAAPQDHVVTYLHYVQGIPFYAQRRTVMVRRWGELEFGRQQGDQRDFFWKTDAELVEAWRSGRRMFLVINRVELEPLLPRLDPAPRQIAGHGKKVVVVNFHVDGAGH
jgi:4-amino-4-deoxy-L-arabinose transferase-like glycosyltransferase